MINKSEIDKLNVPQLLEKLNVLFKEEEILLTTAANIKLRYEQLQEDKEILETMIMYVSNREARRGLRL